mmetsp:Transcript_6130/g.24709  ORF Transcript_6130/g.24709 Transcript_6130/m.24709 type:complete len:722 (+) Transcript_6130:2291-4456(+)
MERLYILVDRHALAVHLGSLQVEHGLKLAAVGAHHLQYQTHVVEQEDMPLLAVDEQRPIPHQLPLRRIELERLVLLRHHLLLLGLYLRDLHLRRRAVAATAVALTGEHGLLLGLLHSHAADELDVVRPQGGTPVQLDGARLLLAWLGHVLGRLDLRREDGHLPLANSLLDDVPDVAAELAHDRHCVGEHEVVRRVGRCRVEEGSGRRPVLGNVLVGRSKQGAEVGNLRAGRQVRGVPALVVGLREERDQRRLLLVEAERLLGRGSLLGVGDVDRERPGQSQQERRHLLVAERPVVQAALQVLEEPRVQVVDLAHVAEDSVHYLERKRFASLLVRPTELLQRVEVVVHNDGQARAVTGFGRHQLPERDSLLQKGLLVAGSLELLPEDVPSPDGLDLGSSAALLGLDHLPVLEPREDAALLLRGASVDIFEHGRDVRALLAGRLASPLGNSSRLRRRRYVRRSGDVLVFLVDLGRLHLCSLARLRGGHRCLLGRAGWRCLLVGVELLLALELEELLLRLLHLLRVVLARGAGRLGELVEARPLALLPSRLATLCVGHRGVTEQTAALLQPPECASLALLLRRRERQLRLAVVRCGATSLASTGREPSREARPELRLAVVAGAALLLGSLARSLFRLVCRTFPPRAHPPVRRAGRERGRDLPLQCRRELSHCARGGYPRDVLGRHHARGGHTGHRLPRQRGALELRLLLLLLLPLALLLLLRIQ